MEYIRNLSIYDRFNAYTKIKKEPYEHVLSMQFDRIVFRKDITRWYSHEKSYTEKDMQRRWSDWERKWKKVDFFFCNWSVRYLWSCVEEDSYSNTPFHAKFIHRSVCFCLQTFYLFKIEIPKANNKILKPITYPKANNIYNVLIPEQ